MFRSKRWIAFFLALLLVVATCINSSDAFLWAAGDAEEITKTVDDDNYDPVVETMEITVYDRSEENPEAAAEDPEVNADMNAEDPGTEPSSGDPEAGAFGISDAEEAEAAQTLAATAKDGAEVTVSAPEGVLPDGAEVTVEEITGSAEEAVDAILIAMQAEGKLLQDLKLYDITVLDKNGEAVQPNGNVSVTIENTGVNGDGSSGSAVYHVRGGSAEKAADPEDADHVRFTADHFGVWGVASCADGGAMLLAETYTYPVYVYIKIDGRGNGNEAALEKALADIGLKKNAQDWYTIGKVENVEFKRPIQNSGGDYKYSEISNLDLGNIQWFGNVDRSELMEWADWKPQRIGGDSFGLHVRSSASDYENEVSENTWHLDGYVNLSKIPYTVRFADADTGEVIGGDDLDFRKTGSFGEKVTLSGDYTVPQTVLYEGKEYRLVGGPKPDELTIGLKGNYFTFYYSHAEKVTLAYDGNGADGGNAPDSAGVMKGGKTAVAGQGDLTKTGHTFDGWNTDSNGTGTPYEAGAAIMLKEDTTLYAQWKANEVGYTVNYHYSDDGSSSTVGKTDSGNAVYGTGIPYDVKGNQSYHGKNYIPDEKQGNSGVVFGTSDGTVSARAVDNTVDIYYILDNNKNGKPDYLEHKVYYVGNGGEGSVEDTDSYLEGEAVTAKANGFTREGMEFAYWKSSENGESIEENGTFAMPDKDITLTAWWRGLALKKEAVTELPEDRNAYAEGDRIDFRITVTNTGDVGLENVIVTDTLDGAVIDSGDGYKAEGNAAGIGALAAGHSITVSAHYIVQKDDLGRDDLRNTAEVTADEMKEPVTDETQPIPVEGVDEQLTVTKRIVREDKSDPESAPAGATGKAQDGTPVFTTGDTVEFEITVTNTGSKTLKDITVEEALQDAVIEEKSRFANFMTGLFQGVTQSGGEGRIEELKPGRSVTIGASYTIKEEDLGKVNFYNVAAASVSTADGEKRFEGESDTIPLEKKDPDFRLYFVTVHYVYAADGRTAAADHTEQLPAGRDYLIYSPAIAGYTGSAAFITGTMPGRDLEFTVYYTAEAASGGSGRDDGPDTPQPVSPADAVPADAPVSPIPVPEGTAAVIVPIAPAEIDDEAVPLQGAFIEVDDNGKVTVIPVSEEEVPLAGRINDEHRCCALHFMLMLTALIVYICCTGSMKKRQKKLAKLKDQLAEETLKRQGRM